MFSTLPSTPILNASTGMSSSSARAWSATQSASIASMPSTPVVSCTVSAVITDNGWQPMLASVRMSACMPGAAGRIGCGEREHDRGKAGSASAGMTAPSPRIAARAMGGLLHLRILLHACDERRAARPSPAYDMSHDRNEKIHVPDLRLDLRRSRRRAGRRHSRRARAGKTCRRTGRVRNAVRARKTSR